MLEADVTWLPVAQGNNIQEVVTEFIRLQSHELSHGVLSPGRIPGGNLLWVPTFAKQHKVKGNNIQEICRREINTAIWLVAV